MASAKESAELPADQAVGGLHQRNSELIEDIRAAVDTTVMATESGTKAVDAGARQFGEVTA